MPKDIETKSSRRIARIQTGVPASSPCSQSVARRGNSSSSTPLKGTHSILWSDLRCEDSHKNNIANDWYRFCSFLLQIRASGVHDDHDDAAAHLDCPLMFDLQPPNSAARVRR